MVRKVLTLVTRSWGVGKEGIVCVCGGGSEKQKKRRCASCLLMRGGGGVQIMPLLNGTKVLCH